jgi:hypothetical protein
MPFVENKMEQGLALVLRIILEILMKAVAQNVSSIPIAHRLWLAVEINVKILVPALVVKMLDATLLIIYPLVIVCQDSLVIPSVTVVSYEMNVRSSLIIIKTSFHFTNRHHYHI